MLKAITSAVLGSMLVLSLLPATIILDAYAKPTPTARPEVILQISISQYGEPQLKDGRVVYESHYMTEEKLRMFYDDVGKVDRIFDTIILPVMNDVVKSNKKEIANKYTDTVFVSYSPQSGAVSIGFSQIPEGFYKTVTVESQPSDNLQITDQFHVEFPVSEQLGYEQSYETWFRNILPNTSVRIGYITDYMQKMIDKHENEIINNYFRGIHSFMIGDMSKTAIYLDKQRIQEYEIGVEFVLDNPISVYQIPEFSTNMPISIVKSSNYAMTVTCASPDGDIANMTLTLTYPDGQKVSVDPTLVQNIAADYKIIEFTLKAEEPEGLYKLVLSDVEPKKLIYCHMNVNRGNDRSFEYVDRSTFSEPVLDRAGVPYQNETWCNYSRLMTVESPDASIFDGRTNRWITIYEFLQQFGEFESTWSDVHFDNADPMYFLHAIKWRVSGSPDAIDNAINSFNSFEPDMKKGRELSLYLIRGDCINAEGKEYGIETETSYLVRGVEFDQQAKKLSYKVVNGARTGGLFKITIPEELLGGEFTVMADGKPHYVSESVSGGSNGTHTVLTYWHEGSAKNIEVIGTEAIPEFPTVLTILVSSIVGSIVISRLFLSQGR